MNKKEIERCWKKAERKSYVVCCVVDSSPLITGGCPEKSLPAGGICACAKWTWNMPRWITEGPSAPLTVPLHDNPGERKREREGEMKGDVGWELERRAPSLILTLVSFTHLPWAALNSVYMYQSFINLKYVLQLSFFPPPFTSTSVVQAPIIDGTRRKIKLCILRWDQVRNSGPYWHREYKAILLIFGHKCLIKIYWVMFLMDIFAHLTKLFSVSFYSREPQEQWRIPSSRLFRRPGA